MIGSLNAIAPFITNFFMISYALINFAAFYSEMSARQDGALPEGLQPGGVSLIGSTSSVACLRSAARRLGHLVCLLWLVHVRGPPQARCRLGQRG